MNKIKVWKPKIEEKQKFVIYLDEKMLIEGKDYTLSFKNNSIKIKYSSSIMKKINSNNYFHLGYTYSYSSNKIK
jgi:hypothetical protein